jgi:hypothetical protein
MKHQEMKPQQKTGRIFTSKLLESMTRTHIALPLTIFYGTAIGLLVYSIFWLEISFWSCFWIFMCGFILFTLLEYGIHKFIFHMETNTAFRKKMQYSFHGIHHDYPKDRSRLAMPPVLSIVLALIFYQLYRLLFDDFGVPLASGFLAGYASYLCVHYVVHAFRPPGNFLKILWTHHAIHHYKEPDRAFGVSSPGVKESIR